MALIFLTKSVIKFNLSKNCFICFNESLLKSPKNLFISSSKLFYSEDI